MKYFVNITPKLSKNIINLLFVIHFAKKLLMYAMLNGSTKSIYKLSSCVIIFTLKNHIHDR